MDHVLSPPYRLLAPSLAVGPKGNVVRDSGGDRTRRTADPASSWESPVCRSRTAAGASHHRSFRLD